MQEGVDLQEFWHVNEQWVRKPLLDPAACCAALPLAHAAPPPRNAL